MRKRFATKTVPPLLTEAAGTDGVDITHAARIPTPVCTLVREGIGSVAAIGRYGIGKEACLGAGGGEVEAFGRHCTR